MENRARTLVPPLLTATARSTACECHKRADEHHEMREENDGSEVLELRAADCHMEHTYARENRIIRRNLQNQCCCACTPLTRPMPAGLGRAEKFNGLPSRKRNKIGLFALRLANERHLARRAHRVSRASSCPCPRKSTQDFEAARRVQPAGVHQVQWGRRVGILRLPRWRGHSARGLPAEGPFPWRPQRSRPLPGGPFKARRLVHTGSRGPDSDAPGLANPRKHRISVSEWSVRSAGSSPGCAHGRILNLAWAVMGQL